MAEQLPDTANMTRSEESMKHFRLAAKHKGVFGLGKWRFGVKGRQTYWAIPLERREVEAALFTTATLLPIRFRVLNTKEMRMRLVFTWFSLIRLSIRFILIDHLDISTFFFLWSKTFRPFKIWILCKRIDTECNHWRVEKLHKELKPHSLPKCEIFCSM